jgi:hypothetical protein
MILMPAAAFWVPDFDEAPAWKPRMGFNGPIFYAIVQPPAPPPAPPPPPPPPPSLALSRPPFWAPRPADDACWSPLHASNARLLAPAKPTFIDVAIPAGATSVRISWS